MSNPRRPPKSAAEIAAMAGLEGTQLMHHVHSTGKTFEPETLVFLIRRAIGSKDTALTELASRLLVGTADRDGVWCGGHCARTIGYLGRKFHFDKNRELTSAFGARALEMLWQTVHAGTTRKPFLEVAFRVAFRQLAIDAARSVIRTRNRDMESGVGDDSDAIPDVDELADEESNESEEKLLEGLSPTHADVLLSHILGLPAREAEAMELRWVEERPIEGGPGSVSEIMGISPRQVYTLLSRARKTLESEPAIRAIWFGEA
jgi:DNA-directed RNA polymerase specialized sigma24 family protein